jgi:hypothetical protein
MSENTKKSKTKPKPSDLKFSCEQGKYNTVLAYKVSTEHIKYKPITIKIPSSKFSNINEAVKKLKERRGGYILKLEPGVHIITKDIIEKVDDLYIVGDHCPFAGMGYFPGINDQDLLTLKNLGPLGQGPFTLTASGNKIIVKGVKNPDFSFFNCERRSATFVGKDGTLKQVLITGADKNDIFFDQVMGTSVLGPGEGFFINPNVVLKVQANNQQILPKHNLHICGLVINAPLFTLGSMGGYLNMTNCVITKESFLNLKGTYRIRGPNVFAGNVYITGGSLGNCENFFIVGHGGHLEADNAANSVWSHGFFISNSVGARVTNGSSITLSKNHFVNNCIGIFTSFGSTATIYGSVFLSNKFGVISYYNSTITNATNNTLKGANPPPIFKNNVYAMTAGNGSYIVIPKAAFIQNANHAIIENKVFTLPNIQVGVHVGSSMVVDTVNPFDIMPADIKCIGGGDTNSSHVTTSFNGVTGIHGIATKEVVENRVIPDNIISQFIGGSSNSSSISCGTQGTGCIVGNPDNRTNHVKLLESTGNVVNYDRNGYVP